MGYAHRHERNGAPTPGSPRTARSLRSTALGGAVVSEYDGAGAWHESFVYAGGERVGRQGRRPGLDTPSATWRHSDPVTGSEHVTEADGAMGDGGLTLDPLGNHVGGSDPFPAAGAGGEDIPAPFDNGFTGSRDVGGYLGLSGGGTKCILDGVTLDDCRFALGEATAGCRDNNCGPRTSYDKRGRGRLFHLAWDAGGRGLGYFRYREFATVGPTGGSDPVTGDDIHVFDIHRVREFVRAGGGSEFGWFGGTLSPARGRLPQNTGPLDLERLKKNLETLVNGGDCADWIGKLINQAAKSAPSDNQPEFTNPMTRFSEFKFSVGTTRLGGTTGGSLANKNATVHMIDLSAPPYNSTDGWAEQTYAYIALHEMIHLAGVRGAPSLGYGDFELATAAKALGATKDLPIWNSKEPGNQGKFSKFWDDELRSHCKFQ